MDQVLEKLFESIPKVRILRLFFRNPKDPLNIRGISQKTRVKTATVRKELAKLIKLGVVRKKSGTAQTHILNENFWLFKELKDLFTKTPIGSRQKLIQNIKNAGKIRLAILSGVFINSDNSRTDIFIAGDEIKKRRVEKILSQLESEIGKLIRYTLMDTKEFKYRLDMYDRFLRDILESPHEKLINKLGI